MYDSSYLKTRLEQYVKTWVDHIILHWNLQIFKSIVAISIQYHANRFPLKSEVLLYKTHWLFDNGHIKIQPVFDF